MDILTVDFETFYSSEFSLTKMQTDAYILDRRFEVIGVCVAVNDDEPEWFSGTYEETQRWLNRYDWRHSAARCHNTMFDGFILTQKFGIRPFLWMDTVAQARMLHPWLTSHSLASMAKFYKLPDKGTAVVDALGKRREDFTPEQLQEYADYCMHDTNL